LQPFVRLAKLQLQQANDRSPKQLRLSDFVHFAHDFKQHIHCLPV
jgi:hypothetical protein